MGSFGVKKYTAKASATGGPLSCMFHTGEVGHSVAFLGKMVGRGGRVMEPLKQLNLAMDYIERSLSSDIDFAKAARLAGSSEYHFRRYMV